MAIVEENICQDAIDQIQAEYVAKKHDGVGISFDALLNIFGLEDKPDGGTNQQNMEDIAAWFEAKEWVEEVSINWIHMRLTVTYTPPEP